MGNVPSTSANGKRQHDPQAGSDSHRNHAALRREGCGSAELIQHDCDLDCARCGAPGYWLESPSPFWESSIAQQEAA